MHDAPADPCMPTGPRALHPALAREVASLLARAQPPGDERASRLHALARYVEQRRAQGQRAALTFICTHNSRRSHLCQLWAAAAAAYFGVSGVETFSGGTEVTAFHPQAVAALARAGFEVARGTGDNPRYLVTYSPWQAARPCFSKTYDDPANPAEGFAAVMTCDAADASCPVVVGAQLRVALPYEDPKQADGTARQAATYDARSRQIAAEMFHLFSLVQV